MYLEGICKHSSYKSKQKSQNPDFKLKNMLSNKTLELTDYLNKYSAQLVFDVLEIEVQMVDIDPVLASGSAESLSNTGLLLKTSKIYISYKISKTTRQKFQILSIV